MELKIDKQVRINFPNLSIIIKKLDNIIIEKIIRQTF
jgi:hypothetical protein